jgi:hypothetical protein
MRCPLKFLDCSAQEDTGAVLNFDSYAPAGSTSGQSNLYQNSYGYLSAGDTQTFSYSQLVRRSYKFRYYLQEGESRQTRGPSTQMKSFKRDLHIKQIMRDCVRERAMQRKRELLERAIVEDRGGREERQEEGWKGYERCGMR